MSKTDAPAVAPISEPVITLTLAEFCSRLSETDRRPELIAGFFYTETAGGRSVDTPEAFMARFTDFVTKPV